MKIMDSDSMQMLRYENGGITMKKIITIQYIVMGSAPNYTGERERWLWGHGLYHAGRRYQINIDPEELIANADNKEKLLEIIKEAVQAPESTVRGTCWDIVTDRASPENVRYSPRYQTIIIDNPYGGSMVVIDISDLWAFKCPFCGAEVKATEFRLDWSVFCDGCGAASGDYNSPEKAKEAYLNGKLLTYPRPHIEDAP